ncbi:MAG: hypothetical protein QXG08_07645 [Candidatus Methanomethyliaceae archaeon]
MQEEGRGEQLSGEGKRKTKFKDYLEEAARKIEELDVEAFFRSQQEEQEKFIQNYVQHRRLDARNWFPFIRIEGEVVNFSRMHFGNGGTANYSLIKKALYEGGFRPLISDNAIAGMFRIPLQAMSREIWGDDEDIRDCGCFSEKGHRFQCLKCLGCGLAGGLKLETGENAVHKVSAVTGVSLDGEIITEYRNALEPRTGTVPKWELLAPTTKEGKNDKDRSNKLPVFWQAEYVAPGAHFPISITFRDVAAAEFGLALSAFDISWKNIGLGAHKNGRLHGWNENPERFTLYAWMGSWLEPPEVYSRDDLKYLINQAKKAAFLAREKKLLVKYVLDVSALGGVKAESARKKP